MRSLLLIPLLSAAAFAAAERPGVVVILADDFGYGDAHCLNPASSIPTPSIDRLAREGVRFTDAHSPSSVCTPTRYGLLTGRYCWRTRLKRGVLFPPHDAPLIEPERLTLARLLSEAGYHTAAIGKWHLGMDWARDAEGEVDFAQPVRHGPTDVGFDSFYGVAASLDMVPYAFYRDRSPAAPLNERQPDLPFPRFVREGPRAEGFECQATLERLIDEAVDYLEQRAEEPRPFFLYLPLTAPHTPIWPADRFAGATRLGPYGDFVAETDAAVGRVLKTLDRLGLAESTLVLFTSDNGSMMVEVPDDRPDHTSDDTARGYHRANHRSNGALRGGKADIWEGGHRVPLLVRWPGHAEARGSRDQTVCLTDVFATLAEVVENPTPPDAGEDSYSFLPLLGSDADDFARPAVVHHSSAGVFAIREGRWKLVLGDGSGGWEEPAGKAFAKPYQLFDLQADPAESSDVATGHPDVVTRLTERLDSFRSAPRSVPQG